MGRMSSHCGSTLSVSNGGVWGVPPPCWLFSCSRNWSWCWAGSGIPPTSFGPVLPGNPTVGDWDIAIKDLERRGWVVESPGWGGWAGGTVVCHSRGLSLCWEGHSVLRPLCPGLWHCAIESCAMAGVSHQARGYCECHTVSGDTMPGTCTVMCAACTALTHAICAVLGQAVPQCPNPGQGSVCQCRGHCVYWNVRGGCIGAGLCRVCCTEGLIYGGGDCIQEVIQRSCCVLGYDTDRVLCTGSVIC